jgi:hypothetical protein
MDSVYALRLSRAARAAAPGGDFIDHGWSIIKALHAEGFDVVPREFPLGAPRRDGKSLNAMCALAALRAMEGKG